jgi:hypothetical protein
MYVLKNRLRAHALLHNHGTRIHVYSIDLMCVMSCMLSRRVYFQMCLEILFLLPQAR